MGMLEIDELTYCKTPLGKIDENFSITKINTNSVTLNKKDIQQFSKNESQFLISSCLCPVKDLKLINLEFYLLINSCQSFVMAYKLKSYFGILNIQLIRVINMKLYSDVLNKQYFIWFCEGSQRYNLMRCLILASQLFGHISAFLTIN